MQRFESITAQAANVDLVQGGPIRTLNQISDEVRNLQGGTTTTTPKTTTSTTTTTTTGATTTTGTTTPSIVNANAPDETVRNVWVTDDIVFIVL